MKKVSMMVVLLIVGSLGFSQIGGTDQTRDRLKDKLALAKDDTSRVQILADIANKHWANNPDTALTYALAGFSLAHRIKFKTAEYWSATVLARCLWSIGDYSTGVKLLLPKLTEIELTHDTFLIAFAYGALGDCYRDQGNYDQALVYDFKGETFEDRNRTYSQVYNAAIASNYLGKKRLDSAQFYIRQAFTYRESPPGGWPLYIRGKINAQLQIYDSAFFWYRQSIPKLLHEDNLKDLAGAYNSMAALSRVIGLKDSALYYAQKALGVALSKKFAKEAME